MVGPAAKREAVAHLQAELGLSERRACSIAGADRKRRNATMTGTSPRASVSDTNVWQLAVLPAVDVLRLPGSSRSGL
jgi:hypothetical protein